MTEKIHRGICIGGSQYCTENECHCQGWRAGDGPFIVEGTGQTETEESPEFSRGLMSLADGIQWIVNGGNYFGGKIEINGIPVEIIIKREGFTPPGGTVEELAKDRVYTLEGFHCALKTLGITEIDGPPMAYMEFPVDVDTLTGADNEGGVQIKVERHIQRWEYVTIKGISTLSNPVAAVELLTDLYKTIKNSIKQLEHICQPMIVWRLRPHFEENIDQGFTTLRCRLYIPGVNMNGIRWVEGV